MNNSNYKLNSKVLYQWEYLGLDHKLSNLERWVFSFATVLIPLFVIMILSLNALKYFAAMYLPFIFFFRYFILPDCKINYFIVGNGLYYTSKQIIPESAYKTVRVIAWIGIALSLIAVFIVGIGALAGAGAAALMGFKLTGFKSETKRLDFLFCKRAIVFDIENNSPIKIKYKDFNERYMVELVSEGCKDKSCSTDLFFNDEKQKQEVILELSKLFSEFELVKVATVAEFIKHEKHREILDSRPD